MKIQATWNSGNFTLKHEAEVDDKQLLALARNGLIWNAQRNRDHDTVLGIVRKDGKKTVRVEGQKADGSKGKLARIDVPYSDDLAAKLATAYAGFELEGEVKLPIVTDVTEYIRDVADSKFTEERELMSRHESEDDLEAWLTDKVGYDGATHGDDGEFAVEALRAVRKYKLAALAAAMGKL